MCREKGFAHILLVLTGVGIAILLGIVLWSNLKNSDPSNDNQVENKEEFKQDKPLGGVPEPSRQISQNPQLSNRSMGTKSPIGVLSSLFSSNNNCSNNQHPIFTNGFTELSQIGGVGAIGVINAGTLSRSYIQVKKDSAGTWPFVPLYAPVKSTLAAIYYANRHYGDITRPEYRLEFQASCEVRYVFDHIAEVSDKIKAVAPATPANDSHTGVDVAVAIEAGEKLGQTNGTGVAGTWDFYLLNTSKLAPHINPARWMSDHNKYGDCPYDYFTPELKSQYYNYLVTPEGVKIEPPNCGQVSHDLAGTAAGGWFQRDATDMKGSRLLVGTNYNLVEVLFERDNEPRFGFRAHNFFIKPEAIQPGQSVCYADSGSYAYLKLVSDSELITVSGQGSCPASFPSSGYETWTR